MISAVDVSLLPLSVIRFMFTVIRILYETFCSLWFPVYIH
jgi:hypothetical protein